MQRATVRSFTLLRPLPVAMGPRDASTGTEYDHVLHGRTFITRFKVFPISLK
jgi:hypothetical protein